MALVFAFPFIVGQALADGDFRSARLSLADVMALAREFNPDVRLARERLIEAAGAVKSERATLLPELEGSIMQSRQDRALGAYGLPESATVTVPEPVEGKIRYDAPQAVVDRLDLPTTATLEFPDPFDTEIDYSKTTRTYNWFNAQLRLRVPVLDLQNYREFKARTVSEERARHEVILAEEKAMNAAASSFLRIVFAEKSVEAAAQRLVLQEQRVAYVADQQQSGLTTELDVMREKQALDRLKMEVKSAQASRQRAARELTALIGWDADAQVQVVGNFGEVDWFAPSPDAALAQAYERRADLLAQLDHERSARLQRDAAAADYYPTLSALGAYGRAGERISDTVDTWMIGVILNVPIWDSFGRQGRLEQRASQLAQTENRTESLRAAIAREVLQAIDALDLALNAIELSRSAVRLTEDQLRLRKDQQAAGVASPMDVNSAEMEHIQALFSEQESLFNYHIASLSFWTALGDVRTFLDPPKPGPTESTTTPELGQNE